MSPVQATPAQTSEIPADQLLTRQNGTDEKTTEKRTWRLVSIGNNTVSPLDKETQEDFERKRVKIESIIRNMPASLDFGRSTALMVRGYKVRPKNTQASKDVDSVVIQCTSKALAAEIRRRIQRSGVLKSGTKEFALLIQGTKDKPVWDCQAEETVEAVGDGSSDGSLEERVTRRFRSPPVSFCSDGSATSTRSRMGTLLESLLQTVSGNNRRSGCNNVMA